MRCVQVRRMLAKTGTLSDMEMHRIRRHLQKCPTCEAEAQRWENFLALWRANEAPQTSPDDFLNGVHQRLHQRRTVLLRPLVTLTVGVLIAITLASVAWFRDEPADPSRKVVFPAQALETLGGTRAQIEQSILDVLEQSITTLRETEDETPCDEEIL